MGSDGDGGSGYPLPQTERGHEDDGELVGGQRDLTGLIELGWHVTDLDRVSISAEGGVGVNGVDEISDNG